MMRSSTTWLSVNRSARAAIVLTTVLLMIQNTQAGEVTITIKKAPRQCAPLLVALYDSKESFLEKPAYKERTESAQGASLHFAGVAEGVYAASAFCDNNNNGEIDKAAFGKPIEPYGFSRNAKEHRGPPRFEDAAFSVKAVPVTVPLALGIEHGR